MACFINAKEIQEYLDERPILNEVFKKAVAEAQEKWSGNLITVELLTDPEYEQAKDLVIGLVCDYKNRAESIEKEIEEFKSSYLEDLKDAEGWFTVFPVKEDIEVEFWEGAETYQGGMKIKWFTEVGFGNVSLYKDEEGQLCIDTEYMGREFAKEKLRQVIDGAFLKD